MKLPRRKLVLSLALALPSSWTLAVAHTGDPEETFRDQKDLRFGMGLSATHIRECGRRDRLLFLSALGHALITLLGAAAESIGYDRLMKANTVKTRTHSLFRQGSYWFTRIPNMAVEKLAPLLAALERQIAKHAVFKQLFGVL